MIIKSMSRKTATFKQLARYMDNGREVHKPFEVYYNNLYSRDSEGVCREFKNNADCLQERKNGNYLYHEVISISRSQNLSLEAQKIILYQLVNDYVELRAKRNLVYGVLHTDHPDNLHFHLMVSSNELGSEQRHRLNKKNFASIQKAIEKNVLNNFPELNQKIIYNQQKDEKTRNNEYELKRRTGKESHRDNAKSELQAIFETAKSKTDLFNKLSDKDFQLYVHGNTIGVKWGKTNKKYRFKTLGLLDVFNGLSGKIQEVENRKETLRESRVEPEFKKETINTRSFREKQNSQQTKVESFEKVKPENKSFDYEDYVMEETPNKETISEKQAEINKRKEELKKSRQNSADYDYNPDKNR
jgi:hypothetical protein